MTTYNRLLHRASDDEKLVSGEFSVAAAVSVSATDYWTVTLYRRKDGDTIGGKLGEQFSSAVRGIAANGTITLYEAETGIDLESGESLWATLVSTGSPATPTNPTVTLVIQRKVM